MVNVVTKKYELLGSLRQALVQRVGDGSIITRFEKTPLPIEPTDVVCPHFLELKWATGCPYDCAWCYLKGTLRFAPKKAGPYFKDLDKVKQHVNAFLTKVDWCQELLNTGELADSLMAENNSHSFSEFILSLFSTQGRHKVLLVTKSKHVYNLLRHNYQEQAIVSFSLNAEPVATEFEKGAPSVAERITAARELSLSGYQVRARIDPLVPIRGWEQSYKALLDLVFDNFIPSRITFGSLRGLQSTINQATDKRWVSYLSERSNWGKKIDFTLRKEIYTELIEYLKTKWQYREVSLCKETVKMWNALGMDYKAIKCNCLL